MLEDDIVFKITFLFLLMTICTIFKEHRSVGTLNIFTSTKNKQNKADNKSTFIILPNQDW